MTVQELIDELEGFDPEAEVRAVQQPNYPLIADLRENGVEGRRNGTVLIHLADARDYYGGDEEDDEDEEFLDED